MSFCSQRIILALLFRALSLKKINSKAKKKKKKSLLHVHKGFNVNYSLFYALPYFFYYLKVVINIFMTKAVTNLVLPIVKTTYVIYNMVRVMHARLDGWMRPVIQVRLLKTKRIIISIVYVSIILASHLSLRKSSLQQKYLRSLFACNMPSCSTFEFLVYCEDCLNWNQYIFNTLIDQIKMIHVEVFIAKLARIKI